MKFSLLLILISISYLSFSFEGIVFCKKIENGVVSNFSFYIKGTKIAIVSEDATDGSKILFDRSANILNVCVDDVDPAKKGYYELTNQNTQKYHSIQVLEKFKLDSKLIQGKESEGFGVKTNQGNATAYYGIEEIDIRGFSTFFNDPVYEVIDASNSNKLPIQLSVTSPSGSYVISLSAEERKIDDTFFELPLGFRKFEVKIEE